MTDLSEEALRKRARQILREWHVKWPSVATADGQVFLEITIEDGLRSIRDAARKETKTCA